MCLFFDGYKKPVNVSLAAAVTLTCRYVLTGCAALVKVPSVGVAPVKDTQPVTPVSISAQVGPTNSLHMTNDRKRHFASLN